MTNEQLNQYYSKDADKKQCWVSKDHNCPLKEQCNGLGSNGTKRLLLQNTASTFDQSNKILDLPDYSRQVIKINV